MRFSHSAVSPKWQSYGIIIISVPALYMRRKLPEEYRLVINVSGFKRENVDKRILRCP